MIKIVFFGSSEYSEIVLNRLTQLTGYHLSAVITKPDKPFGRKQLVTPNPIAAYAQKNHLPLYQTATSDSRFKAYLSGIKPDIGLVVAFGPPFFTEDLIAIPKYKIINIHPSPLPSYRGATPGPWQIINGETSSAVTYFQIDPLPDHGPIIAQIPFPISSNETSDSFYHTAFSLAAANLEPVLASYLQNPESILRPQNHSQKTYYPKFTPSSSVINWAWPLPKIERFIRALNPSPGATTQVANSKGDILALKIFSVNPQSFSSSGQAVTLIPDLVQIEGKTKTRWAEIKPYYQIIKKPGPAILP